MLLVVYGDCVSEVARCGKVHGEIARGQTVHALRGAGAQALLSRGRITTSVRPGPALLGSLLVGVACTIASVSKKKEHCYVNDCPFKEKRQ